MATSVDDIQPDLNKAPPHVEGELLKQNIKATFGRKGWRKYFFIVRSDKLQYFRRKMTTLTNKDPVAFVRMSQVTEITEAVFTGVPKKHHLNCGFSVVSFHPLTQDEQTFNLLAETPEDMRYWVFALRYIKAYWSKMKVRDTVLSADQERKLLDRILQDEDNDQEDEVYGDYGDDEQTADEPASRQISVQFANGSKVKVTLSVAKTTSDLLEMPEIKEQMSSSLAYVAQVDDKGKDTILESQDHPALYHPKSSNLYIVEFTHRLLVVFVGGFKEFESIFVSQHATASEVIEHEAIRLRLDVSGVANRGLFLKQRDTEQPFSLGESPCDVLFEQGWSGELKRLSVG